MVETGQWTPPDDPDLHEILNSAWSDARAGRHDVALAKFVWFHQNALLIDQNFSAVRLSFAIMYWHRLAEDYPPAMDALLAARDQAESSFIHANFQFVDFQELAALNRELGDETRTVTIFKQVSASNSEAARRVYHVAERALVKQREFELCDPFLEPDKRLEITLNGFKVGRRFETNPSRFTPRPPETAYAHLMHNIATLVGLLVINNREPEANTVVREAQAALPDFPVMADLESALAGQLPPAWF
jgi:hypothetical protein